MKQGYQRKHHKFEHRRGFIPAPRFDNSDKFIGYLTVNMSETSNDFFKCSTAEEAIARSVSRNKNKGIGGTYAKDWFPCHYEPGKHFIMLDFLSKEELHPLVNLFGAS